MELRGCIKSPPAERLRGARLRLRPWRREGPRPRSCPGTGGRQRWERGRQSRAHTDTRGCGQGRILPGDAAAGRALPREDAGGGVRGADASLGRVIFGEGRDARMVLGCSASLGTPSLPISPSLTLQTGKLRHTPFSPRHHHLSTHIPAGRVMHPAQICLQCSPPASLIKSN